MTHVLCFFVLNVWIIPFGFFISLSVNESTLPDRLAQSADDVYMDGAARSGARTSFVSWPIEFGTVPKMTSQFKLFLLRSSTEYDR